MVAADRSAMDGQRVADLDDNRTSQSRDRGQSLVEVLIAIVLTGTLAVAGMITLRASIVGSTLDRDHANAHAWLQTATDVLYGAPREDCGTEAIPEPTKVANAYDAVIKATPNPRNWSPSLIQVVRPVKFWDGELLFGDVCYGAGINLQLITIQVSAPDGRIVESVQIVKG